ncbi:MAG: endolytic transglycosylase MltG [Candidatus Methylomirabilales bacterium]
MTTFGVGTYLALHPTTSPGYSGGGRKVVYIKPETPSTEIADLLKQEGVIQDRLLFLFFTLLRGSYDRLKAGEYEFIPSMGLLEVIRVLEEGKVLVHKVAIPEGATLRQVVRLLHNEGLVDRERFLQLTTNALVANHYIPEAETLEGFLFPDTYYFIKGMAEEEIIDAMVQRFFRAFTAEDELRARQLGLSRYEIVTLASIIEKEAVLNREKPVIAGVFYNRLRRGMRLQADPTVTYGRRHRGPITRRDLRADHPYNTYVQDGLPPGPIASPGAAALKAALNPASVKYLYFVSKNDGTHYFSRTLKEHHRAIRRYRSSRKLREGSSS